MANVRKFFRAVAVMSTAATGPAAVVTSTVATSQVVAAMFMDVTRQGETATSTAAMPRAVTAMSGDVVEGRAVLVRLAKTRRLTLAL